MPLFVVLDRSRSGWFARAGVTRLTLADKLELDFAGTPVLITTGDPDPHVPVSRVNETIKIMEEKGAKIISKIYPRRPHTILTEEIELAKAILNKNHPI